MRPAALSMPAASIPRRGAGSRSVASSTMTPAHNPMGRSLSAGCSGWPTHRPPCSSSRTRLSWCLSRTGPSAAVSQSLRVRSQPSRSSQPARSPCQATSRVVADGELSAGSACWPAAAGSPAWPLPVRMRFLHGDVNVRLYPEQNLLGLRLSCLSHLGAHSRSDRLASRYAVDGVGWKRHAGLVGWLREREGELAAVEVLLKRRGGMLLLEGRAGMGKTSLVEVACSRADELGLEVVRARGSELESGFAFGVVRQLFERRLTGAGGGDREALLAGPAAAVRPLLSGQLAAQPAGDSWFAVLHGLYWLVVNLAVSRPLLIAVDDAHWADEPSLRWLAYLAPRLEGLAAGMLVALRQGDPAVMGAPLLAVRAEAAAVLRPALLSEEAVSAVVRTAAGGEANDELCAAVFLACGGNPLYLTELLRAADLSGRPLAALEPAGLLAGGLEGIARQVITRVRGLGPGALGLAQALAVLGDGCELRHAAALAGVTMAVAAGWAGGLVRAEVLGAGDRPRFAHPVIRDALEASLDSGERDRAHRSAARLLHADVAPPGQVAAHLARVRPAGEGWVVARLREAARVAMDSGAPQAAAGLLDRALAEPPLLGQRAGVLREAARAEVGAGRERACVLLEEALRLAAGPRERAEIALEVAEAHAALFRWVDAVDAIERALAELGETDQELTARLEGEVVVCGLHDARRAPRVAPVLARLGSRRLPAASEPFAVAQAMVMLLAGRPADQIAALLGEALEHAGPGVEN